MSNARIHDHFAEQTATVGFKSQSVTTEVTSAELDRNALGRPQAALIACTVTFTTATGAAGDAVEITVKAEDSVTSGGALTNRKTYVASVTVNDDNDEKTRVVLLPVKLFDKERYLKFKVTAAMAAGATGTLSAAVSDCVIHLGAIAQDSVSQGYNKDGFVLS